MVNCEIITIGDELLIGQVIDTNSAWMAQELNKYGFNICYKSTVGDIETDILNAFDLAFSRSEVILVTGGIGPTKDDITKKTLCKYFNTDLVFNEETYKNIRQIFARGNRVLNELTANQAYVPRTACVLKNELGTAPCTWFEKNGKLLISMPGVPYEMKHLMSNQVIPRLQAQFTDTEAILHQTFWVSHYSESELAIRLTDFETQLPAYLKLAYLPSYGVIRLRITGKHQDGSFLKQQMETQRQILLSLLQGHILTEEDKPVEMILGDLLKTKELTLGLAESCTGGNIAHKITMLPGCSAYFKGGIVSYANEIKINYLNIKSCDIEKYGVVSKEVVEQMAKNAQTFFGVDCSIATSGIAGPDGGSEEKPVGTVWISATYTDRLVSKKFSFGSNRENNIQRATNAALTMLFELIKIG